MPPKINDGMPNQEFEKHADFQKNYGSSQFSGATLYDQGSVSSRLSEREFEYPRDLPTSSNVCEPANSSSSTRHQTLAGFNGVRPVSLTSCKAAKLLPLQQTFSRLIVN